MTRRSTLLSLGFAAAALVVLLVSVVLARWYTAPDAGGGNRAAMAGIGGPFTLQGPDGRIVRDTDFRGKWMLIYFGYTHCPDACPTALNNVSLALQQLGAAADRIQPIFITVDPARDDAKTMADYVSAFDHRLIGLTGSDAEVAAAARAYRVYFAKHDDSKGDYSMDHSSIVYAVDPDGKTVGFFTHETTPDKMAAQIKGWLGAGTR